MSVESSCDHGSLYQLRNRIHRTNVGKDPTKDFNACDDFFQTIISGHIISAYQEIDKADFDPTIDWMKPDAERKQILLTLSAKIVDKYIDFSYNRRDKTKTTDQVQEYATQILSLGCFYSEYSDAIKEGDGDRILRCWRYLLPIFWNSGRTNYANEALRMLYQHDFTLSPAHAKQLLWGRCINVHGYKGKNIPADLHMEHLNRVVKDCLRGLGANQTDTAILRIGRALGTIVPVLTKFDESNNVPAISGAHTRKSMQRDQNVIVDELKKNKVFKHIASRKHKTFPKPRNVLHGRDKKYLQEWMTEKVSKALNKKMQQQQSNMTIVNNILDGN